MPNMEDLKRRIVRIVANCNRPKVTKHSSWFKSVESLAALSPSFHEVTSGVWIFDFNVESYNCVLEQKCLVLIQQYLC